MRASVPLALLALALAPLAGCISPTVDTLRANLATPVAGVDADGFAPVLFEGFEAGVLDVPVSATLSVHAETYVPVGLVPGAPEPAPTSFPTILVMSPYFGDGQDGQVPGHPVYRWLVEDVLPRGYAVVLADTAGTGGSSGCWDFMGAHEQAAAVAMVEGIARQPWSDGRIGMIGKSYDGITQILAASGAAEHLVTIVPVAPLTHAYAGLYQNGVHYGGGWHLTTTFYHQISLTPPGAAQERYPGYASHVVQTPTCVGQNTAQGNDPSGAYNAYYEARDMRPKAKDVKASVFFLQGFLDAAVKPDNMFPWFTDVPGLKKAWVGHWEHDYPNATWGGRTDMYVQLHRWFDHTLKGVQNGIDSEPAVDVQDSLGRWRREAAWPPADAANLTLHATPEGALADAPAGEGSLSFGGATSLQGLLAGAPAGALRLSTEPLAAPLHVAGIPTLAVGVSSDRPGGHLVAKLYDVNESGERLVTQGALNLHLAQDGRTAKPFAPGTPLAATISLYPTDYVVEAGHQLVLQLQTVDEAFWFDPDPWGSTLTLALGSPDAPTALTLPVVERADADVFLVACGARIADQVPSCFDETRKDEGVGA